MTRSITKGIKILLGEATKIAKSISAEEAKDLAISDKHIFIDRGDFREHRGEDKVPGAFSRPRGMLKFWVDPESHLTRMFLVRIKLLFSIVPVHGSLSLRSK